MDKIAPQSRLLLVDDDGEALSSLSRLLKKRGFAGLILAAADGEKALQLARANDPHVAVVDLSLDERRGVESGFDLMRQLSACAPYCRTVVLTGHASTEHGIRALGLGAASFLEKPADPDHIMALISDGVRQSELRRSYEALREKAGSEIGAFVVGTSQKIKDLIAALQQAAQTNQPLLITGETGTGKGLCAQTVHRFSLRRQFKFVRYQPNFGSADLVNSELFGHVKGAFTGAHGDRRGLLAEAQGGTLFLDEVEELPAETQVALLGVLQDGKFRALGCDREQQADFRLICACNQNLEECFNKGKLRRDFYHRVAHQLIDIPPLRERKEDIEPLTQHILHVLREREQVHVFEVEKAVLEVLCAFDWPGNVRQLEAVVEGAAYKAQIAGLSTVREKDIVLERRVANANTGSFHERVLEFKLKLIKQALARNGGNQLKAAQELGLDRATLSRVLGRASD